MARRNLHSLRHWKLVVAAVLLPGGSALAQTSQWIGGNSADWNTAGHWSPSGIPGANDTVNVISAAGVTQTITYDYTGTAVTLDALTVDLTGGSGVASETINMSANNLTTDGENIGNSGSGSNGSGTFNQSGGVNTILSTGTLYLGSNPTDTGSYNLSSGLLSASGANELVGDNGTGIFTQTGGTNTNTSGSLFIAFLGGSTGTYTLSNNNSSLSTGQEIVGDLGAGIFNQSGGSNSSSSLAIGFEPGGTGTYTLSNTGSISTGGEIVGSTGTGILNQTGGTNTVTNDGELDIGFSYSNSTSIYSLSGGTLTVNGNTYVGGGSVLSAIPGSGSLTLTNTGQMSVTGSFNLINGSVSAASEFVGGGSAANARIVVGPGGVGAFNQSGGTNTVSNDLVLGDTSGSTATYTLSGTSSSLSVAGNERIGLIGTGNFFQSGGTNTVSGNVGVGFDPGAKGSYTLTGGTFNATGDVNIGGQDSGPGGTGILTVNSSAVLTTGGTLTIYDTPGTLVNLAGGTIAAGALDFNGTPSLFSWTTGQLNVNSNVTWDSAAAGTSTSDAFGRSLTLSSGQILDVNGNETLGGTGPFTLTLNSGSTNTVGGTLTIANTPGTSLNLSGGTIDAAALKVAGGALFRGDQSGLLTVTGPATLSGTITLDGETSLYAGTISIPSGGLLALNNASGSAATISISSGGQVQMNNSTTSILQGNVSNAGLILGAGQINGQLTNTSTGELNVNSGQSLTVTGAGNTNSGLIALGGGILEFTQGLTNSAGSIEGTGELRVTGGLTNNTTLALAGPSSVFGATTNAGAGLIQLSGSSANVFFSPVSNAGTLTIISGASGVFYGAYTGAGSINNNGNAYFNATSIAGKITGSGNLTLGQAGSPVGFSLSSGGITDSQSGLTINLGSTLDLTNNVLAINYGSAPDPAATIRSEIISGYNNGAWNGTGILSSTAAANSAYAVGYADGSVDVGTQAAPGQVLLEFTLIGDTNLDKTVNLTDLLNLLNSYGQTAKDWSEGDFNYDGTVNLTDLLALLNNYGQSATLASFNSSQVVPEPASMSLISLVVCSLLMRRGRRY
jgi:fibronectin-binding autotransporter adhesin